MDDDKQTLIDWLESFLGALEDQGNIQNGQAAETIVSIMETVFQDRQLGQLRPLPNPLVLLRVLENHERQM